MLLRVAGPVSKERGRPAIVRRSRHVLLHAFVGLAAVIEALGSLVTARRRHSLGAEPAKVRGQQTRFQLIVVLTALRLLGAKGRAF